MKKILVLGLLTVSGLSCASDKAAQLRSYLGDDSRCFKEDTLFYKTVAAIGDSREKSWLGTPYDTEKTKQLRSILPALVALGANVNATSSNGFNPLHAAALRCDATTIAFLLACGAVYQATPTQHKGDTGITPKELAKRVHCGQEVIDLFKNQPK